MRVESYPHPVLGNGDDFTRGHYRIQDGHVRYTVDLETIRIKGALELEHPDLQALLETGKVRRIIRLDCGDTSWRSLHELSESTFDITVPSEAVRGRIELQALLIALRDLPEYRPAHVNPLYGQEPIFSVQAGDLLAFAGTVNLPVDLKYDPLTSPLGSLIRLQARSDLTDIAVELLPEGTQSNYFVIQVPQTIWETVSSYGKSPYIISMLVLPALIDVLHQTRDPENEDVISETNWYANLKTSVEKRGLDWKNEDVLMIAQKLLSPENRGGNPIIHSFENLHHTEDE